MVEEARLESVYTSKGYHGFESRSLRIKKSALSQAFFMLNGFLTRGLFPSVTRAELGANPVLSAIKKATQMDCLFFIFVFVLVFVRSFVFVLVLSH